MAGSISKKTRRTTASPYATRMTTQDVSARQRPSNASPNKMQTFETPVHVPRATSSTSAVGIRKANVARANKASKKRK